MQAGVFTFDKDSKCFDLEKGFKFHLLVTHPPCGDACITAASIPRAGGCGASSELNQNSRGDAAVGSSTGAKRLAPMDTPQEKRGVP